MRRPPHAPPSGKRSTDGSMVEEQASGSHTLALHMSASVHSAMKPNARRNPLSFRLLSRKDNELSAFTRTIVPWGMCPRGFTLSERIT
jgi:hypothetical protein